VHGFLPGYAIFSFWLRCSSRSRPVAMHRLRPANALSVRQGGVANLEAKRRAQRRRHHGRRRGGHSVRGHPASRDHVEFNSKRTRPPLPATFSSITATSTRSRRSSLQRQHRARPLSQRSRNIKIERRPNPTILISENPLYFEARDVERFPGEVYLIHRGWITICDPNTQVAVLRAQRADPSQ